MHTAVGLANIYDSTEQAKLIEPHYIIKRNIPPEKPKEEAKD
jgi:ribosomal protein S24E